MKTASMLIFAAFILSSYYALEQNYELKKVEAEIARIDSLNIERARVYDSINQLKRRTNEQRP